MSATLGALLRLVEPDWSITLIERLDGAAAESSDPWNNAGTGHSALCELNYTPQQPDGSIDISQGRQRQRAVPGDPPVLGVRGRERRAARRRAASSTRSRTSASCMAPSSIDYLRRRREALAGNPLFASMEYIDDPDEFARRLPLMAAGRDFSEPVALNWTQDGTDVDFGSLSRQLIGYAAQRRHDHAVRPRGHATCSKRVRRQLDAQGAQPPHRRQTEDQRQVRVRRRRRRRAAAAAEVRHQGGQGLRRLPGRRRVPAHRQPGADRGAPGQGVRPCRGSAPRRCRCRTWTPASSTASPWLLFGPFAGWSPKFLKQGTITDLPVLGQARQPGLDARRRRHRAGSGQVPDRPAAAVAKATGSRRCANSRPAQSIRTGSSIIAGQRVQVIRPQGQRAGCWSSVPRCSPPLTAASPVCSAPRRARRPRCRPCSTCWSVAFPTATSRWLPKLKEMMPSLGTKLSERAEAVRRGVGLGHQGAQARSAGRRGCRVTAAVDGAHGLVATVTSYGELGQGSRRRDALRTAQAAGRGVRRRAGLPRIRNSTAATCSPKPGTSGWRVPTDEVISHAAADGGARRRARRRSGSAGCAPNAAAAGTATPPGCCRRRWPRSATTRAGSTRRPTLRNVRPARIRPRR